MPRPARPASNFTSDRHTLYAGWVLGELIRSGLPVEPVRDASGNYTNRITVNPPLGGESAHAVTLMIPPPPDDWDLFAGGQFDGAGTADGPIFRGEV